MRPPALALLVLCGCLSASSTEQRGSVSDGGTTKETTGGLDAATFAGASTCPDHMVASVGARCRSQADCPADSQCKAPEYVYPYPPCVGGAAPPAAECGRDLDCPAGKQCANRDRACPQYYSKCVVSSCAEAHCPLGFRCRTDGHCELLPCNEGWDCGPGARCEPSAVDQQHDANGCVAVLCTEGFTCPKDQRCAIGHVLADGHGCRPLTCADGIPCSGWQSCQPLVGYPGAMGCAARPCTKDRDCGCGICLDGAFCASGPGVCHGWPSFPP